MHPSKLKVF